MQDREAHDFTAAISALKRRQDRGIRVIFTWLELLGVPMRDRADLAQEVLLRAFMSWHTFDPSLSSVPKEVFRRWLNAITNHTVSNYRHVARHYREELHEAPVLEDTVDDVTPAPDARLERRATRTELATALLCVPSPWRRAVAGSIQLLAERSGQPSSTLYKLRHRARVALVEIIALGPIDYRRAQLAALTTARRVLRAQGLDDAAARALLGAAVVGRCSASMSALVHRGGALGLPPTAGPFTLAALAFREAAAADDQRANALRELAVSITTVALIRLMRAYGGPSPLRARRRASRR